MKKPPNHKKAHEPATFHEMHLSCENYMERNDNCNSATARLTHSSSQKHRSLIFGKIVTPLREGHEPGSVSGSTHVARFLAWGDFIDL